MEIISLILIQLIQQAKDQNESHLIFYSRKRNYARFSTMVPNLELFLADLAARSVLSEKRIILVPPNKIT